MVKKLVNFRVDPSLWLAYQNHCQSLGISATDGLIDHINSTLGSGKDECKDIDKTNQQIQSLKRELIEMKKKTNNQRVLLTEKAQDIEAIQQEVKDRNAEFLSLVKTLQKQVTDLQNKTEKLANKIQSVVQDTSSPLFKLCKAELGQMLIDLGVKATPHFIKNTPKSKLVALLDKAKSSDTKE